MIRLAYISCATATLQERDLERILTIARRNNQRDDITGMMIYHGGTILQVLEGPVDNVRKCYDRIHADPRHNSIYVLDERNIKSRAFSQWSMGLADAEALQNMGQDSVYPLSEITERLKEAAAHEMPKDKLKIMTIMTNFLSRFDDIAAA